MDDTQKKRIVEALILAAPEPIPVARLVEIVPRVKPARIRELVDALNAEYEAQDRAFEIWEVAGGYQIRTRQDLAPWVQQLHKMRVARLSNAALETLSVVAYRQPITRAEIEQVRGVDVGATMRSLVERKLVRIAGHREVPGRPMLYATTRRFLEVFGLKKIEDLPTLRDLEELGGDELLASLGVPPEPSAEEGGRPDREEPGEAEAEDGAEEESSGPGAASEDERTAAPSADGSAPERPRSASAPVGSPGSRPAPRI